MRVSEHIKTVHRYRTLTSRVRKGICTDEEYTEYCTIHNGMKSKAGIPPLNRDGSMVSVPVQVPAEPVPSPRPTVSEAPENPGVSIEPPSEPVPVPVPAQPAEPPPSSPAPAPAFFHIPEPADRLDTREALESAEPSTVESFADTAEVSEGVRIPIERGHEFVVELTDIAAQAVPCTPPEPLTGGEKAYLSLCTERAMESLNITLPPWLAWAGGMLFVFGRRTIKWLKGHNVSAESESKAEPKRQKVEEKRDVPPTPKTASGWFD